MKNVTILLAVLAVAAMAVPAFGADLRWNAPVLTTPDDWHDAANWQMWDTVGLTWVTGYVPTASDKVYINRCGERYGTPPPPGAAEITGNAVTGNLIVERCALGGDDRTAGHIIQYHGSTLTNTGLTLGRGNHVYTQKGGTHTCSGNVSFGNQPGGNPTYNHEGGIFNQTGGSEFYVAGGTSITATYNMSQDLVDGNNDPILSVLTTKRMRMLGLSTFNITGGTATHAGVIIRGVTGAAYNVSGGTITTSYLAVAARYNDEPNGTGTFHVQGSGATGILINSLYNDFSYVQRADGTLLCEIDSGTSAGGNVGITEIIVHTDDDDGLAIFGSEEVTGDNPAPAAAAVLDIGLLDSFTPTASQYFRLMTADTIEKHGGGLVLAAGDEALWTITWGTDGDSDTMGVTYVPEPATMCLLAVGGIGVLIRRRRK